MAAYHPLIARNSTQKPRPVARKAQATSSPVASTGGRFGSLEHRAALDADQRSIVAQQLDRGGEALPDVAKRSLGPLYGERLSDVRLHRGAAAETVASGLSAKAFTAGRDVFWPRFTLDPSNIEERSSLSHELSHAVSAKSRGVANSVERQPADAPTTSPDQEYLRGALVSYAAIAGTYAAAKAGKRRIEDAEVTERLTSMRTALGPIEGVIFRFLRGERQPTVHLPVSSGTVSGGGDGRRGRECLDDGSYVDADLSRP
ncbi:MAG: DUF4157 domain-containing protein [Polyangiaceae bacterium]